MQTPQDPVTANIDSDLSLVNEQIVFHERQAKKSENEPYKHHKHLETASRFRMLKAWISALLEQNRQLEAEVKAARPRPQQLSLALTQEDIAGLPDELIKELSLKASDRTEFAIISLLDEAGGILSLDKILIGLYRKGKEIHKRQALVQRLYRMTEKGLVFNVPGKKGVYSRYELTEAEVAELFHGATKEGRSNGDLSGPT